MIESPKQSDQNKVMESKQNFFRGSHQFWMMSDEFWIISLKTPFIQTTPKSRIMSHGVQTSTLPWAPPILENEL